ncbi:MAG: hypothetical protein WC527_02260 [Candidatus Margulisiibacteriota bacterium]
MEQRKNLNIPISDPVRDAFLRSSVIPERLSFEKDRIKEVPQKVLFKHEGASQFWQELETVLHPNLPAKDLISSIVKTALLVQMGKSFTLTQGFDKMVEKISAVVMADPLLRRQALATVSLVLENKNIHGGNIKNG